MMNSASSAVDAVMTYEPVLYSTTNPMQIRGSKDFLIEILPLMDWSDPSSQVVMDMGCGTGCTILNLLLPGFPEIKSLIGVDISSDMIEFAKKRSAHPKITYEIADIQKWEDLKKWEGGVTKIFSFYCLHWVRKQDEVFKNMFHLMRPGGEAALFFVLTTPIVDDVQAIKDLPKWNKFYQEFGIIWPESHDKRHGAKHYESILEDIGFSIVVCEEKEVCFAFEDETIAREFYSSTCSLTKHIPEHLKKDFKEDLYNLMKGKLLFNYTALKLLIRKPRQNC